MSYTKRHLNTVTWVYSYLEFIALPLIVFKLIGTSTGYITVASFVNDVKLWIWIGFSIMEIAPILFVFGFVKYLLRLEKNRLESIIYRDENKSSVEDDLSTYPELSVKDLLSNLSNWTRFFSLAYSVMIAFYIGMRIYYAAELSLIASVYLVDAFMVISLVMIIYLEQKQKRTSLLT